MLDKYIWGDVSRISREAPMQVVNVLSETYGAGAVKNNGGKGVIAKMKKDDSAANLINDFFQYTKNNNFLNVQ
ncbi:MAG: hypothetical protein AABX32_06715 [Nanoarchaeota archaeon]